MAQTEKQLTEQLTAVESNIEAIDVQIASDPPETSERLLELGEPRYDAPAHHHQLALSGVAASTDDGLQVTRRDVPIGRNDPDVVRSASHMEVLGDLLLVEE
jgi:hypothetical protein